MRSQGGRSAGSEQDRAPSWQARTCELHVPVQCPFSARPVPVQCLFSARSVPSQCSRSAPSSRQTLSWQAFISLSHMHALSLCRCTIEIMHHLSIESSNICTVLFFSLLTIFCYLGSDALLASCRWIQSYGVPPAWWHGIKGQVVA